MEDQLGQLLDRTEESYRNVHPGIVTKQPGWEVWYAEWLLMLSDIRDLLGVTPTPYTLQKLLLRCEAAYNRVPTTKSWGVFAAEIMRTVVAQHRSAQEKT